MRAAAPRIGLPQQQGRLAGGGRTGGGWPAATLVPRQTERRSAPRLPRVLSAGAPAPAWQTFAFSIVVGLLLGAALVLPWETATVVTLPLIAPFAFAVLVRVAAIREICRRAEPVRYQPPRSESDLPVYSVLVPLYCEAAVVPDLVQALAALDYPARKLDVLLVVEFDDGETSAALGAAGLEPSMRVVVVPPGSPRTKPRALRFALRHARGRYVVVYDAEDMPEPDQLRRALAAFRRGGRDIGCVQAGLSIHNAGDGWLARQFAIEYAALFAGFVPALVRSGWPVPLGGTSNHFPRAVLDAVGGWDAHNVTEDADLGVRLARFGYRVAMLPSKTWEEAPAAFGAWLKQRTRWLKGWMQTYLVHMRQPRRLWRELGPNGFMGFQVVMGGNVLSALVHPWLYVALLADALRGDFAAPHASQAGYILWWLSLAVLAGGYLSAMLLGALAAARSGQWRLVPEALAMPFYWLLVSLAAYRAIVQFARAPFLWEKTQHRARALHVGRRILDRHNDPQDDIDEYARKGRGSHRKQDVKKADERHVPSEPAGETGAYPGNESALPNANQRTFLDHRASFPGVG